MEEVNKMAEENSQSANQQEVSQSQPEVNAGQEERGFSSEKVASMAETLGEELFGKVEKPESKETSKNNSKDEEPLESKDEDKSSEDTEDTEDTKDETELKEGEKGDSKDSKDSKDSASSTVPAPKTWRNDAVTEWDKLPPVVKAEVIKREEDFHKGIEMYRENAEVGRKMLDIYAPHVELLTAHQVDPYQLASGLLNAHIKLSLASTPRAEKEQMFLKMASDYGIDLNTLDSQYVPQEDPSVLALKQEVESLKSTQIEQTKLSIKQQIEAFASDPANIYFDDVANDMTMLIRGGAKSLKEAYDKAILMSPVVRAKEEARIAEKAKNDAEAERQRKVKEAAAKKGANLSNTSSKGTSKIVPKSLDDLDLSMKEIYRKIHSKTS